MEIMEYISTRYAQQEKQVAPTIVFSLAIQ